MNAFTISTDTIAQAAIDGEWAAHIGCYYDENEAAEDFGLSFFSIEHSIFTDKFRKVLSCS